MLHHIVFWTLEDADGKRTPQEVAKFLAELGMEKMHGKIESLKSLEFSYSFADTTTMPMHLLLHSTHENAEDLANYANHPIHVEFASELKRHAKSRQAIDYYE